MLDPRLYGFGDAIQGARFVGKARRLVREIAVFCPTPLARLMARCPGVDRVVADLAELPPVAAQARVWGLPAIFGADLDAVQVDGPHLSPDDATVERWRPALAGIPGFRVGVVWQGNPAHANDRHRSFCLAELSPLAAVPGVKLVSLQQGFGTDQLAGAPFPIVDLGPEYAAADLLDAAGVMSHLDLVVAADTGFAHLAAAAGRPTWLVLSSAVEWRWMLDREDTPWYPTMRLVRQERLGEWGPVFRRMTDELCQVA